MASNSTPPNTNNNNKCARGSKDRLIRAVSEAWNDVQIVLVERDSPSRPMTSSSATTLNQLLHCLAIGTPYPSSDDEEVDDDPSFPNDAMDAIVRELPPSLVVDSNRTVATTIRTSWRHLLHECSKRHWTPPWMINDLMLNCHQRQQKQNSDFTSSSNGTWLTEVDKLELILCLLTSIQMHRLSLNRSHETSATNQLQQHESTSKTPDPDDASHTPIARSHGPTGMDGSTAMVRTGSAGDREKLDGWSDMTIPSLIQRLSPDQQQLLQRYQTLLDADYQQRKQALHLRWEMLQLELMDAEKNSSTASSTAASSDRVPGDASSGGDIKSQTSPFTTPTPTSSPPLSRRHDVSVAELIQHFTKLPQLQPTSLARQAQDTSGAAARVSHTTNSATVPVVAANRESSSGQVDVLERRGYRMPEWSEEPRIVDAASSSSPSPLSRRESPNKQIPVRNDTNGSSSTTEQNVPSPKSHPPQRNDGTIDPRRSE